MYICNNSFSIPCIYRACIGSRGLETIFNGDYQNIKEPSIFALYAAIISIVVKEFSYWYTRDAAKKINSGSLMADAWHHRSDALSSVGSFIGILGGVYYHLRTFLC